MRGSAATLAPALITAAQHSLPDLLVVSDMIDLGDLLARLRRTHPRVPVALYLHENQLTYPRQVDEALDVGLAWTTWKNLTLADEIWCNSAFHCDELLAGLPTFLGDVPDHSHLDELPAVADKMCVLPVGVDLPAGRQRSSPPLIVSNQRWHHDKDVGAVVRAMVRLATDGAEFRAAVIGDDTGGLGAEINPMLDDLGDRLIARGRQPRRRYEAILGEADIVVSAARNEFFGVAVVEAVGAGAVPVLPNAVAYPEVIPPEFHPTVLYEQGGLRRALGATLAELPERRAAISGLASAMNRYRWPVVAAEYDRASVMLVESAAGGDN
jgi:glycosyltransferase involved in cell wall biosynthesis